MYPNNNCNDCPDCPGTITPLPLPDLTGLCGDEYNAACVIYTGEDITCLGIESGMSFLEVLNIFNNTLPICDCCEKVPQDCVLSEWGPWSQCECYYNEDDELICGRSTRTKTVITPAANGGAECGPLIDYKVCDVKDVCFTFGSDLCESAPDATQILASPAGILNNKPYYLLEFDCGAPDLYVWYSNSTFLWHVTPTLNVTNSAYQTLNNSSNYLPISNNTTQRWSYVEGGDNYLIASQITTCPDVNICFEFYILTESVNYTFYANIAPTSLGEGSFPIYQWTNNDAIYGPYTLIVEYSIIENKWVYIVYNSVYTTPLTWGTLDTNTFYPISTSTIEWQPVENIAGYGSQLLSSTQDACVAPPDVDCVWTCTPWSACNAGCTQTRTCTITTPASGNGTCEESPITQQSCCVPSCPQPISPTVTVVGANIQITFLAVAGAVQYTLTYTSDGILYTNLTSTLPSFSFPWICGQTYSGWVVTNCATLNSAQTTFSITVPPCPEPELCNGDAVSFIMGNISAPQSGMVKINSSAGDLNTTKPVLGFAAPSPNNTNIYTAELANDGIFIGTLAGASATDQAGLYTSGGVIKLNCTSSSTTFFGQINRTFNAGTAANQGFGISAGSTTPAVVRAIKYHKPSNRIFVGGIFQSYKGVPCSANLVCLNATTGAIIPQTIFKIGTSGLRYTSAATVAPCVYDIQFDESDPTETKIVVAGAFNSYTNITGTFVNVLNLVRLNFDGTLDPTFSALSTSFSVQQSARDVTGFITASSIVKTIHVDALGDIYAGGAFYTYRGTPAYNIVKIKKNGDIAPVLEFNSGTGFLKPNGGSGINSGWSRPFRDGTRVYGSGTSLEHGVCVERIIPHVNGILVTGNFAYYNSSNDTTNRANGLIKLNTNGTRDTSFTIDTATVLGAFPSPTIGRCGYDVSVLNNNNILFAGYLTSYLGASGGSKGYYVLNSNGTVNSTYTGTFTASGSGSFLFFNRVGQFFL
jgi:hypothetical protein